MVNSVGLRFGVGHATNNVDITMILRKITTIMFMVFSVICIIVSYARLHFWLTTSSWVSPHDTWAYLYLGMSSFNCVNEVHVYVTHWSTNWLECTQMTVFINMFRNIFLLHLKVETHDTCPECDHNIFPLDIETQDYHLEYSNVLL